MLRESASSSYVRGLHEPVVLCSLSSVESLEEIYLANMRSDRKMECEGLVDPVWYHAVMKKRRQKEREEKNQEELARQLQFKSLQGRSQDFVQGASLWGSQGTPYQKLKTHRT